MLQQQTFSRLKRGKPHSNSRERGEGKDRARERGEEGGGGLANQWPSSRPPASSSSSSSTSSCTSSPCTFQRVCLFSSREKNPQHREGQSSRRCVSPPSSSLPSFVSLSSSTRTSPSRASSSSSSSSSSATFSASLASCVSHALVNDRNLDENNRETSSSDVSFISANNFFQAFRPADKKVRRPDAPSSLTGCTDTGVVINRDGEDASSNTARLRSTGGQDGRQRSIDLCVPSPPSDTPWSSLSDRRNAGTKNRSSGERGEGRGEREESRSGRRRRAGEDDTHSSSLRDIESEACLSDGQAISLSSFSRESVFDSKENYLDDWDVLWSGLARTSVIRNLEEEEEKEEREDSGRNEEVLLCEDNKSERASSCHEGVSPTARQHEGGERGEEKERRDGLTLSRKSDDTDVVLFTPPSSPSSSSLQRSFLGASLSSSAQLPRTRAGVRGRRGRDGGAQNHGGKAEEELVISSSSSSLSPDSAPKRRRRQTTTASRRGEDGRTDHGEFPGDREKHKSLRKAEKEENVPGCPGAVQDAKEVQRSPTPAEGAVISSLYGDAEEKKIAKEKNKGGRERSRGVEEKVEDGCDHQDNSHSSRNRKDKKRRLRVCRREQTSAALLSEGMSDPHDTPTATTSTGGRRRRSAKKRKRALLTSAGSCDDSPVQAILVEDSEPSAVSHVVKSADAENEEDTSSASSFLCLSSVLSDATHAKESGRREDRGEAKKIPDKSRDERRLEESLEEEIHTRERGSLPILPSGSPADQTTLGESTSSSSSPSLAGLSSSRHLLHRGSPGVKEKNLLDRQDSHDVSRRDRPAIQPPSHQQVPRGSCSTERDKNLSNSILASPSSRVLRSVGCLRADADGHLAEESKRDTPDQVGRSECFLGREEDFPHLSKVKNNLALQFEWLHSHSSSRQQEIASSSSSLCSSTNSSVSVQSRSRQPGEREREGGRRATKREDESEAQEEEGGRGNSRRRPGVPEPKKTPSFYGLSPVLCGGLLGPEDSRALRQEEKRLMKIKSLRSAVRRGALGSLKSENASCLQTEDQQPTGAQHPPITLKVRTRVLIGVFPILLLPSVSVSLSSSRVSGMKCDVSEEPLRVSHWLCISWSSLCNSPSLFPLFFSLSLTVFKGNPWGRRKGAKCGGKGLFSSRKVYSSLVG